jgi:hypothetical protein
MCISVCIMHMVLSVLLIWFLHVLAFFCTLQILCVGNFSPPRISFIFDIYKIQWGNFPVPFEIKGLHETVIRPWAIRSIWTLLVSSFRKQSLQHFRDTVMKLEYLRDYAKFAANLKMHLMDLIFNKSFYYIWWLD